MTSWRNQRWQLAATVLKPGQGGIARVARMTARALIEEGVSLDLLALVDDTPTEIAGRGSVAVNGSRVGYAARTHAAAFTHDQFLYDSSGPARAHPRVPGLRRPYGVWLHGVEAWEGLTLGRERTLRQAAFVLVNSHYTLARFEALHGPLPNAHVCPLATEEDAAPAHNAEFAGPPTTLILARIDAQEMYKGHTELIEAWPSVIARVPDARLLIAGDGSGLETVRTLAKKSSAVGNIDFLGFVPAEAMPALWRRTHVFAMPSRGEGFGLVYIEAMRHGLPVIASRQDAGQEVNHDGVTGFNVDQHDIEILVGRIVDLLTRQELARSMGLAGQQHWHNTYRYSLFAARFIAALDELCAE